MANTGIIICNMKIILLCLVMGLQLPAYAANVPNPRQESHANCCEWAWVDMEVGSQYIERWLCYINVLSCKATCDIVCHCGLSYQCGSFSYDVVLCLEIPVPGGAICGAEAYDADQAPVGTSDGVLGLAQGCDAFLLAPCDEFQCQIRNQTDECAQICGGIYVP